MAKRKRAAWIGAAWVLAAGGCTKVAGLDDGYHLQEGEGGAAGSTGTLSSTSATGGGGAPPAVAEMIDDMEDGDNAIHEAGGRKGYWYSFNDGTEGATQTPPAGAGADPFAMTELTPPRGQSTIGACTKGSGFTEWGAAIALDLLYVEATRMSYDGSAYRGITFWAKHAAGTQDSVKVLISDKSTTAEGGHCDPEATEMGCNDNWAGPIRLSEQWEQHVIAFEDMKVSGWGLAPLTETIDTTTMYSIRFQVAKDVDFDFCVDDIGFYE
ncbi:hypothetical protein [Sorangium sp. So ce131]|uniref:hypothetical protein n=1 Tax=Sorangium sp. So ce131 TaxID=3133282 RepID=UPI003F6474B4